MIIFCSCYIHSHLECLFSHISSSLVVHLFWCLVHSDLSKGGLKEGGLVGVVPGCGGVAGGWDGQDRLSSLPPLCLGWIGDYSSRCVIRMQGEEGRFGEGGMLHRNHISLVLSEFIGCAKLPYTHTDTQPHYLTLVPSQLSSYGTARQEAPWHKHVQMFLFLLINILLLSAQRLHSKLITCSALHESVALRGMCTLDAEIRLLKSWCDSDDTERQRTWKSTWAAPKYRQN